jgi:hypothetical protein
MFEVGVAEAGVFEVGPGEVGVFEVDPVKVGVCEVGHAEAGVIEVWHNFWILVPPLIPSLDAFIELRQMFRIFHVVLLRAIFRLKGLALVFRSGTRP